MGIPARNHPSIRAIGKLFPLRRVNKRKFHTLPYGSMSKSAVPRERLPSERFPPFSCRHLVRRMFTDPRESERRTWNRMERPFAGNEDRLQTSRTVCSISLTM